MLRVPQEPSPREYPETKGVVIPESLDLETLASDKNKDQTIQTHIDQCLQVARDLTNVESGPYQEYIETLKKAHVQIDSLEEPLEIRIDHVKIAGVSSPDLLGVRHAVDLPWAADVVLDGLVRSNYTELIDKFTYLVESVTEISTVDSEKLCWCHVAYTADRLSWFLTERDFCTLDFCTEDVLISRSCQHGNRPRTALPRGCCCSSDQRTYRVPLFFANRVVPRGSGCTVVQFQYSDIGGIVPPNAQTKAVVQFGLDNIPKVVSTLAQAMKSGVKLGMGSPGYLENPLKPKWRQNASEMLPGLE